MIFISFHDFLEFMTEPAGRQVEGEASARLQVPGRAVLQELPERVEGQVPEGGRKYPRASTRSEARTSKDFKPCVKDFKDAKDFANL